MKIQFKRQQFQADAAAAVVRVFRGQPKSDALYNVDPGKADASRARNRAGRIAGKNQPLQNLLESGERPSEKER